VTTLQFDTRVLISLKDTSQESKEASKKALEELGGEKAFYGKDGNAGDGVREQKQ